MGGPLDPPGRSKVNWKRNKKIINYEDLRQCLLLLVQHLSHQEISISRMH